MKRAFLLNLCLALLLGVTGSVGCRKKPIGPTPIPRGGAGMGSAGGQFGATGIDGRSIDGNGDVDSSDVGRDRDGMADLPLDIETGMLRDEQIFQSYTVYFEFDRSTVRSNERSKIESVAAHLEANPAHKLKVEGHCDERGTEGYNLALGERRALSVRDYLINLGIAADRVTTTSFGELRPKELGQNEAAWAANRRAEFILLLPRD